MGSSINATIMHSAVKWHQLHGTGVKYHRPVDGCMMYTDTDFECHSNLSATFSLTLNKPVLYAHTRRRDTVEPIHLYSRVLLNPHALLNKGQPEIAFDWYLYYTLIHIKAAVLQNILKYN